MTNQTVLVVEDNAISREGMVVVLRKAGYQAVAFPEGEAALEYLRANPAPCLILLDMVIPPPGHDGWWLLGRLRHDADLANIPVYITTGLGVASKEWAASLGARGFFRKPMEVEPLLAEVQRCLAG